ncbi:unnamed protein product [Colias eurytheme]|nr:unnamed protein product [Colias eurytheme]
MDLPESHDYLLDDKLTEFSQEVTIYIAGFIVKKLKKQIKCYDCILALQSTEKLSRLIALKDVGGLNYPSTDTVNICVYSEKEVTKESADDTLKLNENDESTAHAKPELPNFSTELPRITKPTHHIFKAKPKKTGKSNSNYEHQLFLLAKKSREELMKQQQELHLIRIKQEGELTY